MSTLTLSAQAAAVQIAAYTKPQDDDTCLLWVQHCCSTDGLNYRLRQPSLIRTVTVGPGIAPVSCLAARGLATATLCITAGRESHPAPKVVSLFEASIA
jgi:hypothetical protein